MCRYSRRVCLGSLAVFASLLLCAAGLSEERHNQEESDPTAGQFSVPSPRSLGEWESDDSNYVRLPHPRWCSLPGDWWIRTDYLQWWTSASPLPPLLTTGPPLPVPPGTIGDPNTTVLFGDGTVNGKGRPGVRVRGGRWCDPYRIVLCGSTGCSKIVSTPWGIDPLPTGE